MPKTEKDMVRCIDCERGINGNQDCGAGGFEKSPMLGCYLGAALPDDNSKKGTIPKDKIYKHTYDGMTKKHTARKKHKCDICGKTIFKGNEYLSTMVFHPNYYFDSGKMFWKSCMECECCIIGLCGD